LKDRRTDEHYGIERIAAFDLGWDGNSVKGDSYASMGRARPQHFRMSAERNKSRNGFYPFWPGNDPSRTQPQNRG
jgi:hypothetical protein